eukprot:804358_1
MGENEKKKSYIYSNVLDTKFFKIFPNLKQVLINTTHQLGELGGKYYWYAFDLQAFLLSINSHYIETTQPIKYIIQTRRKKSQVHDGMVLLGSTTLLNNLK